MNYFITQRVSLNFLVKTKKAEFLNGEKTGTFIRALSTHSVVEATKRKGHFFDLKR